uniref:Phospholipase A2 group IVC n=2 Tax=Kryptolebias marmoratus TaxID=37003 RepID=A0A3Q3AVY9_KRYMA
MADRKHSKKAIRQSPSLCAGELDYINRRKHVVLQALCSKGINCSMDSVPHIALLASGGGQRAAVGLMGSLYQMEKDGLLDTLLYIAGVSGSTWSMASLYSDPQWSSNMDDAVSRLSSFEVELEQVLAWVGERSKEENFSLSDIWGVLTTAGIMKQMDVRHLSHEANRDVTNPYPIYCAVEKYCFSNGLFEGKWFELSPHEAGFTELGLFVDTSLLGCKFQGGELLEKKPEMDIVWLQGVLGSMLADEETLKESLNDLGHIDDDDAEKYLHAYKVFNNLISLIRSTLKDPTAMSDLDQLQKALKDKVDWKDTVQLNSKSPEERKSLFQQLNQELLAEVETWSQSLEDRDFKPHVSFIREQILPLICKWEWGTTNNFLYQYQDSSVPACLRAKEQFHLIDAGLLVNVAYPSFLGEKRDIDLIIAPEYSAGNMFETLTLARAYATKAMKPFPEIDDKILEDRDWPKDCYVFEGKDKEPTIIYMPLFNQQNCKDAEEFKAKMEEFTTLQRPYSQEKIVVLLETVKSNIRNNRETLLREINNAVIRQKNKRPEQDGL